MTVNREAEFSPQIMTKFDSDLQQLGRRFETITATFHSNCLDTLILVQPKNNPHQLYDYYLAALLKVYFNKYTVLCESLIQVLNAENYLMYGLIGRSIIEHTAILRYYVTGKMLPLVDLALEDGIITEAEVSEIIPWIEQHLVGHRFQWEDFLGDYFEKLDNSNFVKIKEIKQVNVITCLEKWIKNNSKIERLYTLFSDMVHPNLGSTLLVTRLADDQLGIGGERGEAIGLEIVRRTFEDLIDIFEEVQLQLQRIQTFKFSEALRQ